MKSEVLRAARWQAHEMSDGRSPATIRKLEKRSRPARPPKARQVIRHGAMRRSAPSGPRPRRARACFTFYPAAGICRPGGTRATDD